MSVRKVRAILLLCALVVAAPAIAQVIDRVLVVVNEGVITESEFIEGMRGAILEYRARGQEVPERRVLEERVMEQLILERIQLQMADRLGISVSPVQVERAMADIARRQGLSPEDLLRQAQRAGLDPQRYREEIEKQLRIQRLVDREVRRRITVSQAEIDELIATMGTPEDAGDIEYEVAHISLLMDDPDDEGERSRKLELAAQILDEIAAGASFESLARRHSDSPTAEDGGSLGWRAADKLPDLFLDAVKALQPGEISGVLDSERGIHLVMLIDRRGGGRDLVEQWKVRHILVAVDDETTVDQAMATARRLRERILQGEEFAELARVHSADAGSRINGGDLGWVGPGDTAPDFEEAVRNLEFNQLSEPIETRFGLHLIEVLDRRMHDVGTSQLRLQAERTLREQKGLEAYEQWLRKIRDEAYVKFRVKPG